MDVIGNGESQQDGNCIENSKKIEACSDEGDALLHGRPTQKEVVARMPVEKNATHYNMNHKYRGRALIFNHRKFDPVTQLKERSGTDEDCKNLSKTLKDLGFSVDVFNDLLHYEIRLHIEQVARLDHNNNDCLLVAVLSHGEAGIIYAKDTQYKPDVLWSPFTADKCPSLAGKPKIFLLQACQGDQLDGGVVLSGGRTETDGQMLNSYRIPTQADFLIVYSTVKGYYSWRNTTRGSWFVQALCSELNKWAHEMDFLSILTRVSAVVAFDFESNVPEQLNMHQQKQIPCIMSMLTRAIQFTPIK